MSQREIIQVSLFEGVFGIPEPPKPNTGVSYVHQFHTDKPLPEYLRDKIEQLIQDAINK